MGHLVDLLPVKRRAKYPLLSRIIFRDVYRDYPIVKRPYTRNIIHAPRFSLSREKSSSFPAWSTTPPFQPSLWCSNYCHKHFTLDIRIHIYFNKKFLHQLINNKRRSSSKKIELVGKRSEARMFTRKRNNGNLRLERNELSTSHDRFRSDIDFIPSIPSAIWQASCRPIIFHPWKIVLQYIQRGWNLLIRNPNLSLSHTHTHILFHSLSSLIFSRTYMLSLHSSRDTFLF